VQILGRGGFADVWEAVDSRGDRIAVKFMASKNSTSSVREMRIIPAIKDFIGTSFGLNRFGAFPTTSLWQWN
jgi:hypothetical protein